MDARIATGFGRLWALLPRTRDPDDELAVKQVRVASRRLRAAMEIGAPCYSAAWFGPLLDLVKGITGELGAVRDAEVMLAFLETERELAEPVERPGIERLIGRTTEELAMHRSAVHRFLEEVQRSPLVGEATRHFGPAARPPSSAGTDRTGAPSRDGGER
jgi:CHAD domain-containing protein